MVRGRVLLFASAFSRSKFFADTKIRLSKELRLSCFNLIETIRVCLADHDSHGKSLRLETVRSCNDPLRAYSFS